MQDRSVLLRNATLVDATWPEPRPGCSVLIEGDVIREVSDRPIASASADAFDVRGKTLMPGLIDCHVHVVVSMVNIASLALLPDSVAAFRTVPILRGMLDRGFTTVRDAGGADAGLALAVDQDLVAGPRLFVSGKALSQGGGHGDIRGRFDDAEPRPAGRLGVLSRVVDGVDAVRAAARDELR
ncbi:MAG TPA: amidohydrolase family protein, partial [bacterium]|nr:amidohydrolase family protein [bacterium]